MQPTISSGTVTVLPSGSGRSGVAKHLRLTPRCPRSPAGVLLTHLSVHELVDDLCKKPASLCICGEMLGIAAAARAHIRAVTWGNSIHTLCTNKK